MASGVICGSSFPSILAVAGYADHQFQEQRPLDYPVWNDPFSAGVFEIAESNWERIKFSWNLMNN
jgi:hypothetical protein